MNIFYTLFSIIIGILSYVLTQAILTYFTKSLNSEWLTYIIQGISIAFCLIVAILLLKKA